MHELSKLADDWETLAFCVQAIGEGAKCKLAHMSFKQGELLKKSDQNGEALKFYSIAVAASGCRDAGILRARGKCLESLQEYTRAIRDFSAVLALPNSLISDFCARAVAYMMNEDDEKACRDFVAALERDANTARNLIASRPGNDATLGIFVTSARIAHARKDYEKSHGICEYGLMLDQSEADLLALKEKCENHMQKCIVM